MIGETLITISLFCFFVLFGAALVGVLIGSILVIREKDYAIGFSMLFFLLIIFGLMIGGVLKEFGI